jgi:tetratricopeptide (TPR) repeat protein
MFPLSSCIHRSVLILLVLSSVLAVPPFGSVGIAQEPSREEALKEAGRLGTEAERLRAEAYKKLQAGADRTILTEAERAAAEKFRQAIELWRAAGDYKRLVGASEELSRIYSVVGDYEKAIGSLQREAEFWQGRNDLPRQTHALWLMGIRQMQMRREKAASETFERVVEMSRAAGLFSVERNALGSLASLYDKLGRVEESEELRRRAKELWSRPDVSPPEVRAPSMPAVIPTQWADLDSTPLVAQYREVDGVKQAVLVNRSSKGIEMVSFGCAAEEGGKTQVLNGLIGIGLNHGGVRPGFYYAPFAALNRPQNPWTDEKMSCEGAAKIIVTEAIFADGSKWKADGLDWVTR